MRLPVAFPGVASLACLLAVSPAAGQAESALARASSGWRDLQKLASLLLPPAFGQDNQVRAPMLIANEMRPESRDRLAQPSARPESRDRLARPVSELPAYRPESRDPLARSYEEVRTARPELLEAGTAAAARAQAVAAARESAMANAAANGADAGVLPVALSAVPVGAASAAPTLQRTTQSQAEGVGLAPYLPAPWQQIGFIAGLVLLASLLFWRLGARGRQGPLALTEHVPTERGAEERAGKPRYATLREAIEAMKAEAAARR